MIEFLSSWAEQIVIAIIIASIIEMILPENKNKKYVKIVIGIYILFSIISPFINGNDLLSTNILDLETYATSIETEDNSQLNQTSMNERIQKLYIEELEENIKTKVEEEGYSVVDCSVDAVLYGDEEEQGINEVKITIYKSEESNSNINTVDKIEINVGLDKYISSDTENDDENEISDEEINNLKKVLSDYYEIEEEKIKIKSSNK